MRATLIDWERVLKQMILCQSMAGYIDFVESELHFFEDDPKFKDTCACYVSRDKIREYMRSHHHGHNIKES